MNGNRDHNIILIEMKSYITSMEGYLSKSSKITEANNLTSKKLFQISKYKYYLYQTQIRVQMFINKDTFQNTGRFLGMLYRDNQNTILKRKNST